MKRTLSLVLALVMVLGSFTSVFAAEQTVEEKAAAFLKDAEVLAGNAEGDLMLEDGLKRRDAVILVAKLMGEFDTAKDFPMAPTFEDITDDFYVPFLGWAQANGTFVGHNDEKFGFADFLTTQEYASVLLRVLGYEVAWDATLEEAKELGLLADIDTDADFVRGNMAVMTLNALAAKVNGSDETLAVKLNIELPVEEPEVPAALEVKEVVADNLKSFTVVFNQAVKSAEVTAKTTAKIDVTVELSEDKMSAVGYYNTALDQSTSVTFTVNAETEDGLKVEDLEVVKVVTDTTVPTVLSAKALNPKQIEVLFSEPVQLNEPNVKLLSDIKVDGTAVVAEASVNYTNNKVVLTLLAPMTEGTKKLEIGKVKDFANFVAPTANFDITVVKDEAAPVATLAEVKNNKEIVVTFNEPLSKVGIGTFEVDGKKVTTVAFVENSNNTQVKLTLDSALSIGAVVEVKVGYKGQKDIMGNEVKETTYITTKVADDTALPTVELTKVETGNKVTLTFSKPMADDAGKYTVLDKDGKVYQAEKAIDGTFNSDKTVLTFTGAQLGLASKDSASYSIKLTEMKDASIRSNPLAATTLTFTSVDTKAPTVDATYKVTKAEKAIETGTNKDKYEDKITIYFSEAMDVATIENLANYMLGGTTPLHTIANVTKAVAAADAKSVTITYLDYRDTATSITVLTTVKDAAGNKLASDAVVNKIADADLKLTLDSANAKLVALNKIEVEFNSNIATVYPSVFSIYEGSERVNNYFISAEIDGTTVTFTTAADLDQTKTYTIKVVDASLVINKFGNKLTVAEGFAGLTTIDEVNPTIKVAKNTDNSVKFTFSEEVQIPLNAFNNLMVRKADGSVTNVTVAVYAVDADGKQAAKVTDSVYGKAFIVYLNVQDVTKVKVGFPVITGGINDKKGNFLLPTDWLEIK